MGKLGELACEFEVTVGEGNNLQETTQPPTALKGDNLTWGFLA